MIAPRALTVSVVCALCLQRALPKIRLSFEVKTIRPLRRYSKGGEIENFAVSFTHRVRLRSTELTRAFC